jgi:hypothetical protein
MTSIAVRKHRLHIAVEYFRDQLGLVVRYAESPYSSDEPIYMIYIDDPEDVLVWELAGGPKSMDEYIADHRTRCHIRGH